MSKPILCVDFDGVIHSYTSGWKGADVVADGPVPGALPWLRAAMEHFRVCIYSSRTSQDCGSIAMRLWLGKYASIEWGDEGAQAFMEEIEFPEQKPAAFLTIDDRAVCFEGDWTVLDPRELTQFKPWNKRDHTP